MENLSGQFSFVATSKEAVVFGERFLTNPLKVQDEARVFIDDKLIITGFIEDLSISYSVDGHSISVSGRDQTGDLVDSSFYQDTKEYSQRDFKRLIELVLKDNGYTNIKVINEVSDIQRLGSSEVIKTNKGDTIFSFIDRYAQKLQVLLITDEDGNIVITREGLLGSIGSLISEKNGKNNNILSANININSNNRFRFIEVHSQSGNDSFALNSVSQNSSSQDDQVRSPRRRRVAAKISSDKDFLSNLAKWHVNINRAKGQRYSCRLVGYYTDKDNNNLWIPNTLVKVKDDKCQLDGEFLIQGVTYTKSNSGSFTDLSIVNRGAFTLDTKSAIQQISSNDFANNLFKPA